VTASGHQFLAEGRKELIANGPSCDLDADLRLALFALFVGGDRKVAVDFLRRSAARKQEALVSDLEVELPVTLPPLAYQYRNLRAELARALMRAEVIAAQAMAKALPQNRVRNRKASNKARS
jgi:hypothetical protein